MAVPILLPLDVLGHGGAIGATQQVGVEGVLEPVEKAHVLHACTHASGSHKGRACQRVAAEGKCAQHTKIVQLVVTLVVGLNCGHALGTVLYVAVVAAGVPVVNTGNTPVHGVICQQRTVSALAVQTFNWKRAEGFSVLKNCPQGKPSERY